MKDNELRAAIAEEYPDGVLLIDYFDASLVGITTDGRAVYDYERMIDEYMEDYGCSLEDALDWIHYNTLGSLPYCGDAAPVIFRPVQRDITAGRASIPADGYGRDTRRANSDKHQ